MVLVVIEVFYTAALLACAAYIVEVVTYTILNCSVCSVQLFTFSNITQMFSSINTKCVISCKVKIVEMALNLPHKVIS